MRTGESDPIQEELIRKEECIRLYEAISQLTPLQRRRIQMLMEDMNYTQIARVEGRNPSVIYRSIQGSFLHLRRPSEGIKVM